MNSVQKKISQVAGFTLVELLIVIAVIGVLAAVILAVINPVEQLARGRDAGRKSTTADLANAVQRFYVSRTAYPAVGAVWITDLKDAGEVRDVPPTNDLLTTPCTTNSQAGYCFLTGTVGTATQFIVFTPLESAAANDLCTNTAAPTDRAWEVWSSTDGQGGIVCTTGDAVPPVVGAQTFVGK